MRLPWKGRRARLRDMIQRNPSVSRDIFKEALRDHLHERLESDEYDRKFSEAFDAFLRCDKETYTLNFSMSFWLYGKGSNGFFDVLFAKMQEAASHGGA